MPKSTADALQLALKIGDLTGDKYLVSHVKELFAIREALTTAIVQHRSTAEAEKELARGLRLMTRQAVTAWKQFRILRSRVLKDLDEKLGRQEELRQDTADLLEKLAEELKETDPADSEELARRAREVRRERNVLEPVYRGNAALALRAKLGAAFGIIKQLALMVWRRIVSWVWRHLDSFIWDFALCSLLVGWLTAKLPALPIIWGGVLTPFLLWLATKYALVDRVGRWLENRRRDRLVRDASRILVSLVMNRCRLSLLLRRYATMD